MNLYKENIMSCEKNKNQTEGPKKVYAIEPSLDMPEDGSKPKKPRQTEEPQPEENDGGKNGK